MMCSTANSDVSCPPFSRFGFSGDRTARNLRKVRLCDRLGGATGMGLGGTEVVCALDHVRNKFGRTQRFFFFNVFNNVWALESLAPCACAHPWGLRALVETEMKVPCGLAVVAHARTLAPWHKFYLHSYGIAERMSASCWSACPSSCLDGLPSLHVRKNANTLADSVGAGAVGGVDWPLAHSFHSP